MPRSAIPGAIDTLHLYPRPVLVVALHITDRSTRDDIVATPFGDLFNHLRHGPDDDVPLGWFCLPASLFADPCRALLSMSVCLRPQLTNFGVGDPRRPAWMTPSLPANVWQVPDLSSRAKVRVQRS